MNSSFLYHAWGIYAHECTREEYKGNTIILHIQTKERESHYSPPSLEGIENIGIDEFAVRKGHVYKTIVVDLDSGRVLYVGDGKGADIFDKQHKTMLDNALAMNEPLSKAYYLKEQLRQIWMQPVKAMGECVFDDWVRQAEQSKIPQLQKMAVTMRAYKSGILAWYDCHLSTGKVEGINNKIKVMKRNAYGFRDDKYFTLRLYALHDCRITRNVG